MELDLLELAQILATFILGILTWRNITTQTEAEAEKVEADADVSEANAKSIEADATAKLTEIGLRLGEFVSEKAQDLIRKLEERVGCIEKENHALREDLDDALALLEMEHLRSRETVEKLEAEIAYLKAQCETLEAEKQSAIAQRPEVSQ